MSRKPILVMMSYRGGERLRRCLDSIAESESHFSRVVLSVTSAPDSEDMRMCLVFQESVLPRAEILCTNTELPTMQHQSFWVSYLESTEVTPADWIYWLAYDDEVRERGISAIVDEHGDWAIEDGTVYLGPWAMRHETADELYSGSRQSPLESWTSFPENGPLALPVLTWIRDQVRNPTYMQMSGSVAQFTSYLELRDGKPTKQGPMRIEMALASARSNRTVAEFPEPVSIIYGRSNSDRSNYTKVARREDVHLLLWTARYTLRHPAQAFRLAELLASSAGSAVASRANPQRVKREEWRVRGDVTP